jgi:SAM domain (Sterile alpha motif)
MDIVVWLRSLGLGRYEAAFRENEIDETVLPSLTAEEPFAHDRQRCNRLAPATMIAILGPGPSS